ncbi:MAG: DUF3854 domain-containing protein [Phormidium tanganyikae FI6-MK23]|nr:DUF3854 domain-containing protein [Phormidium tanganyikae FI6-MK23]
MQQQRSLKLPLQVVDCHPAIDKRYKEQAEAIVCGDNNRGCTVQKQSKKGKGESGSEVVTSPPVLYRYREKCHVTPPNLDSVSKNTQSHFIKQIEKEFIEGSAIHPDLFAENCVFHSDLEYDVSGNVTSPIHDALNWHLVRFGHQANQNFEAVLIQNEDGSTFQAKLSKPRTSKNGKVCKYESPKGNGARAFLPTVPASIRQLISEHYLIEVPLEGSFWDWVKQRPEIPVIITEGAKKALSLLSLGYVAISSYGVASGIVRKDEKGLKLQYADWHLIADLQQFNLCDRAVVFAFDQDVKSSTNRSVNRELGYFADILKRSGASVKVATWHHSQAKGVDDLIAEFGEHGWWVTYENAQDLEQWRIDYYVKNALRRKPDITVNTPNLTQAGLELYGKDFALVSPKATFKTVFMSQQLRDIRRMDGILGEDTPILLLVHRISLGSDLCPRLGLQWRNDCEDRNYGNKLGTCIEGLSQIDIKDFRDCILTIDEAKQVAQHLLCSKTTEAYRPYYISKVKQLIRNCKQLMIADADLDDATIRLFEEIRGKRITVVKNEYVGEGYNATISKCKNSTAQTRRLIKRIESKPLGKTIYIATDNRAFSKTLAKLLQKKFPELRILLINQETVGDEDQREFMKRSTAIIDAEHYDVVIATPTLGTGTSIESHKIDSVWGFFTGQSIDAEAMMQALIRVRHLCDRFIWVAEKGRTWKYGATTSKKRVKEILSDRAMTDLSLASVGQQLMEDFTQAEFTWKNSPFVDLYCHFTANKNRSALNLASELEARLMNEGHNFLYVHPNSDKTDKEIKKEQAEIKQEIKIESRDLIENAADIEKSQVDEFRRNPKGMTQENHAAVAKYYVKEFYAVDEVDETLLEFDNEGRNRSIIRERENLFNEELATERANKSIFKATHIRDAKVADTEYSDSGSNDGELAEDFTVWDFDSTIARRKLRLMLNLGDFLKVENREKVYKSEDYAPYAELARKYAEPIKKLLGVTITAKVKDVRIVNDLLAQIGVKMTSKQVKKQGKSEWVYLLDQSSEEYTEAVLKRRSEKWVSKEESGSEAVTSPPYLYKKNGNVTPPNAQLVSNSTHPEPVQFTEADIEDYRSAIEDCGNDDLLLQILEDTTPDLYQVAFSRLLRTLPESIDLALLPV